MMNGAMKRVVLGAGRKVAYVLYPSIAKERHGKGGVGVLVRVMISRGLFVCLIIGWNWLCGLGTN